MPGFGGREGVGEEEGAGAEGGEEALVAVGQ